MVKFTLVLVEETPSLPYTATTLPEGVYLTQETAKRLLAESRLEEAEFTLRQAQAEYDAALASVEALKNGT